MSQLDIIDAQRALAARLRIWGLGVDVDKRAAGFIDDLVRQGWQMSAQRETRPSPLKRTDQCARCGGVVGACHCTREQLAADYERDPNPRPPSHADASLARALLAQTRAQTCGCGVRAELCPVHREAEEAQA